MLLSAYTNDRNGEQCFQEMFICSEKQARGPVRKEILAAALPLQPSVFVLFVMKNVKRKMNLKLRVAGHVKGIVGLMGNVTWFLLVP